MSIQHKIEQNKGIKNDLWGIHLKKLKKKQKTNKIPQTSTWAQEILKASN